MGSERIYELAAETVRRYRSRSPFEIARSLGIDVDFADLGGLKGFYIVYKNGRYIVINHNLDERMAKLVLAHEIGHDLLHRELAENGGLSEKGFFDMKSKPERQANLFAANLLITDKDILGYAEEGMTLENIARTLDVHYQLALIKAGDMAERGYEFNLPCLPDSAFLGSAG